MALIEVFDKRTGKPVPQLVPEHWLDNPKLGGNYVRSQAAATAAMNATEAAAHKEQAKTPKEK